MSVDKLNIQEKSDNPNKKALLARLGVPQDESLSAQETNKLVGKTNELVEKANEFDRKLEAYKPVEAFNFKGNVATYANLPTTNLTKDDAYGVVADGLVYIYNGTAFPASGQGLNLGLKPSSDSKVTAGNQLAVSGDAVKSEFNKITRESKNKYNPETRVVGMYLSSVSGGPTTSNSSIDTTARIRIEGNKIVISGSGGASKYRAINFYDINGVYLPDLRIEVASAPDLSYVIDLSAKISAGAYEFAVSFANAVLNYQIEFGEAATSYEPYGLIITDSSLEASYRNSIIQKYSKIDNTETLFLDRSTTSEIAYSTGGVSKGWAMVYRNDTIKTINGVKLKPTFLFNKIELQILKIPNYIEGVVPESVSLPTVLKVVDITDEWNNSLGVIKEFYFDDLILEADSIYAFGVRNFENKDIGMYVTTNTGFSQISSLRPRVRIDSESWGYAVNSQSQVMYCVLGFFNLKKTFILNKDYLPDYSVDTDKITNNAIDESKIKDGAISEDKTIFFEPSKNLFNSADAINGFYISSSTGLLTANPNYTASGFINVVGGEYYFLSYKHQIAWYDSNKLFIGGSYSGDINKVQQAPTQAKFLRCTIHNNELSTFMVNIGQTSLPYEKYGFKLKTNYINPINTQAFKNDICLPSKLYILSGVQNCLFIEPFVKRWLPYKNTVRFSGNATYSRRLERLASISNTSDATTVTASLIDLETFVTEKQISSTLQTSTPSIGTNEVKIQIIGDSFTQGAFFKDALLDKGYVPNLKMIGLRNVNGYSNQYDEGRGGWKLSQYFEVQTGRTQAYAGFYQPNGNFKYWGSTAFWKLANDIRLNPSNTWTFDESYNAGRYTDSCQKFDETTGYLKLPQLDDIMYDNSLNSYVVYNGTSWIPTSYNTYEWAFNFSKYLSMWNLQTPDFLFEMLGLNDFRSVENTENIDFTLWNERLIIMKNSFKTANPNGKFIILTPCSTCGILDNEAGDFTLKQNAAMWTVRNNIIKNFDNRENESIYLVDVALAIDNIYGYNLNLGSISKPFDSYTGTEKIVIQSGNPHPYASYPTMGVPVAAFLQKFR